MKFLRLIRIENILIVLLTQLLMSIAIISPILKVNGLSVATPTLSLLLILIGTALITMGGYIINDYFDTRIDEINKPHRVLIGKAISRHKAMQMHQLLTIAGVACGLFVAWQTRSLTVAMIFLFIPGLLWFYSTSYKREFFIGNFVVAAITAFVPLIIALVENQFLIQLHGNTVVEYGIIANIYKWVGFFAIFAFTLTILREMVKDLEDEKGDREMECRTVPIVIGELWAKIVIAFFTVLLISGIAYIIYGLHSFADHTLLKNFLLYGVCAPLLFFIILLFKAKSTGEYTLAQNILKVIMLIGVLFSLAFLYAI